MNSDGNDIETEECTRLGWTGTASELIVFMLIDGYNMN